jgi:hypothetical protein
MPVLGTQVIKSIQRGATSVSSSSTGSATSATATINAVDLDKSFVSISSNNGYGVGNISSSSSDGNAASSTCGGGYLSSTTGLTFSQGPWRKYNTTYGHNGLTVYWEVIEYV